MRLNTYTYIYKRFNSDRGLISVKPIELFWSSFGAKLLGKVVHYYQERLKSCKQKNGSPEDKENENVVKMSRNDQKPQLLWRFCKERWIGSLTQERWRQWQRNFSIRLHNLFWFSSEDLLWPDWYSRSSEYQMISDLDFIPCLPWSKV